MAVFFGTSATRTCSSRRRRTCAGRVMAIYMLLTLGTTVVGGPFVGWVCQHWNPRVGLGFAGVVTLTAAVAVSVPIGLRRHTRDVVAVAAPD